MKSDPPVPYAVIVAAKNGDPDAMYQILVHYNGLIEGNSRRRLFDEYGNIRSAIDEEIKDRIQAKIIEKVIYDFDPNRLPEGETLED